MPQASRFHNTLSQDRGVIIVPAFVRSACLPALAMNAAATGQETTVWNK